MSCAVVDSPQSVDVLSAADAAVREAAALDTQRLREARLADVVDRISSRRDALGEQVDDLTRHLADRDAVIADLRAQLRGAGTGWTTDPGAAPC